jgi:hypothetical protein
MLTLLTLLQNNRAYRAYIQGTSATYHTVTAIVTASGTYMIEAFTELLHHLVEVQCPGAGPASGCLAVGP